MTELAVEARGLTKAYGETEALRGVDLEVRIGEIFALIGPNGAGKTTALEILEGHRRADAGEVRVLGHDPQRNERAYKERIGIVLQSTSIQQYLRVYETIDLFRGYYPHPLPTADVLKLVGLEDVERKLVRRLSGGQQRRLDVGIGIAGNPDLLFLDEPTTGFDPSARRTAWEMIWGLKSSGKTILLTTHYMEEAQNLADRVAIILGGRIVALGTPNDLRSRSNDTAISFRDSTPLQNLPSEMAAMMRTESGRHVIHTNEATRIVNALTSWALDQGVELEDLTVAPLSLEDVYLQLSEEAGE
jgi:ABC-2 type transport system ATP-binding protein